LFTGKSNLRQTKQATNESIFQGYRWHGHVSE
jgi:hypothetical protein